MREGYLGTDEISFTMNFSKGGSTIIAQYYQFLRLGHEGYRKIMSNLMHVATRLRQGIQDTGGGRFQVRMLRNSTSAVVNHRPVEAGRGRVRVGAGHFVIFSKTDGVPLVAAGLKPSKNPKTGQMEERPYTCFDVCVPPFQRQLRVHVGQQS